MAFEVLLPPFEVGARRDDEADVVEARPGLGEDLVLVGVVHVQREGQRPVAVGEDAGRAPLMWGVHQMTDREDLFVPADAGVQIGDGERDVMDAGPGRGGIVHDISQSR